MVILTLEYDEIKLDECTITCKDIIYKTCLLDSITYLKIRKDLKFILHNLAQEAKYITKERIIPKRYYEILIPINMLDDLTISISEYLDDVTPVDIQTLKFNVSTFYDIYTKLLLDYDHYVANHVFLCKDDLKIICNTDDVPNIMFNTQFTNLFIHYIPSINKSFIIDNNSLGV